MARSSEPYREAALLVVCALFTSAGQIFYKIGAARLPELVTNVPLIVGLFCYGAGFLPLIAALRSGSLTVLYPILASSYIWTSLISSFLFHEDISLMRWAGMFCIIVGVSFVGHGSRRDV